MIGVLPDQCLVTTPDLQHYALFRQCVAYEAYKIPNMTNVDVHNALFAKTFLYLFNISSVKGLCIEFFLMNILPYVKDYQILILEPIFKKVMQKIYLMLTDRDFHFSKDFQTRNYHGNIAIQTKRLKLCRKHFKDIFAMVLKEVQIQDKALNIARKYNGNFLYTFLTLVTEPKLPKSLQLLQSENIGPKAQAQEASRPKAFDVFELHTHPDEADIEFGNVKF